MIHDVGLLVSLQTDPEQLRQVCEARQDQRRARFLRPRARGDRHGPPAARHRPGRAVEVPRACQLVAGYHHQPSALADSNRLLVTLVYVADTICCQSIARVQPDRRCTSSSTSWSLARRAARLDARRPHRRQPRRARQGRVDAAGVTKLTRTEYRSLTGGPTGRPRCALRPSATMAGDAHALPPLCDRVCRLQHQSPRRAAARARPARAR